MLTQEIQSTRTLPRSSVPDAPSQPKRTYCNPEALVGRIRAGDPEALVELYKIFRNGVRLLIARQLGWQDVDDRTHDIFVVVVRDIQRGALRDAASLPAYVRSITRRQIAGHIDALCKARNRQVDCQGVVGLIDSRDNPEQQFADKERVVLMRKVLGSLSSRDRDILFRFYVRGQQPAEIQAEMGLTETQFRLLKSRAKSRFTERATHRLRLRCCS